MQIQLEGPIMRIEHFSALKMASVAIGSPCSKSLYLLVEDSFLSEGFHVGQHVTVKIEITP